MHGLVIVEDHPVMRRGLEAYFAGTGRRQILGSVPNLEEARTLLSRPGLTADILLLTMWRARDRASESLAFSRLAIAGQEAERWRMAAQSRR
jgi:DNA-binding NarL/FixJ family response regulator